MKLRTPIYDPQGRNSDELLKSGEVARLPVAENRVWSEGPKSIDQILDATVARIEQLFQQPRWRYRRGYRLSGSQ